MTERPAPGAGLVLRRLRVAGAAALVAFLADRGVKWWVMEGLALTERGVIEVAPPFLRLVMAWNEGANFGLGAGLAREVWITVAVAISAGLAVWATRMDGALRRAAVGALIGGALANALDRALWGAVADFLNMSCCGIRNPYAFNPADVFIFLGAAGLILLDGSEDKRGDGSAGDPEGGTR